MLEFKDKKLVSLKEGDLKSRRILESGLQEAIVSSWEVFKSELNMPQLNLIGTEVRPDSSVQNSIDILAFDSIDNVPVVIELKRDKNKLQLLQAISYASMVATWEKDDYLQIAKSQNISEIEDLEDGLNGIENEQKVKIILIAEKFDPEVMISSDWLSSHFNLDISTFSLKVFERKSEVYFNFSQTYPLPELKDVYEVRNRSKAQKVDSSSSWDEIRGKFKYEWASPILDAFLKHSPGDAKRKRFPPLVVFRDIILFEKVAIYFQDKWVRVYLWGKPDNAERDLKSSFGQDIEIGEWRDGYSIKLKTEEDGKFFLRWLKVE